MFSGMDYKILYLKVARTGTQSRDMPLDADFWVSVSSPKIYSPCEFRDFSGTERSSVNKICTKYVEEKCIVLTSAFEYEDGPAVNITEFI